MLRTLAIKLRVIKFSDLHIGILLYGVLGIIVVSLVYMRELDFQESLQHSFFIGIERLTWNLDMNDLAMGGITALMAILLFLYAIFRRWFIKHPHLHKMTVNSVLVVMVMISGLLYLYVARGIAQNTFMKAHDSYHYLLGPKYFTELGYFGLYEATLIADAESDHPIFRSNDQVRNLLDYSTLTVREIRNNDNDWKAKFTQERWNEFCQDIEFYKTLSGRHFRDILQDRGYNGTPFHAYISGLIANSFQLTYRNATYFCLLDILGLLFMMILLSWAFGWKIAAIFAVFFFTNAVDRYYHIGGSFFRYWWMISLGSGIALVRRRAYFSGSLFLTTAAMLNAFPLFFLGGIGIKALLDTLRHKRLRRHYPHFMFGFIIMTILLGSLSISHGNGLHNYDAFLKDMSTHSSIATFSRIGFRYLFLLPKEFTKVDEDYGFTEKRQDLKHFETLYFIAGTSFMLVAAFLARKRTDAEATILVGISTCFFIFNTVRYYYMFMALFIILWSRGSRQRFSIMAGILFSGNAIVYGVWYFTHSLMICNNYLITLLVLVFLFISYGIMIDESLKHTITHGNDPVE